MHRWLLVSLVLLTSCTPKEPLPPQVEPLPPQEDLTAYQEPQRYVPPPPPVLPPPPKAPVENELRYEWEDGKAFEVKGQPGYPIRVRLEPGERITMVSVGDRPDTVETDEAPAVVKDEKAEKHCKYSSRWEWCYGVSEAKYTPIEHLVFTATHTGQKTGAVILTDRRAYDLDLQVVRSSKIRIVSWNYPPGPAVPEKPPEPGLFPPRTEPRQYRVGYTMVDKANTPLQPGQGPDFTPIGIWSDLQGHPDDPEPRPPAKIYIQYAPLVAHKRIPIVRGVNQFGKPYLLNSRQAGSWLVLDELAEQVELRRGVKDETELVKIVQTALETIQCPADPRCPRFPH